jgi:hypothetical protein
MAVKKNEGEGEYLRERLGGKRVLLETVERRETEFAIAG